ncbi:MAG TPA: hypothetical protein VFG69_09925, partial [Nannocystaceae bacterium]|nr:hypothetical protein [Nannocystaceae bacterium]
MRRRARAHLGLLPLAAVLACSPSEPPTEVSAPTPIEHDLQPVTIRDPADHWEDYVELVPAVRLPTSLDQQDRIQVFVRLPEGGKIRVDWLGTQDRHTVRLPVGASIDRVESWRYHEPSGEVRETVVDVRGLRMTSDGPRYHVLRPASGAPRAPLLGWSWPADDPAAHAEATDRLETFLRGRPAPVMKRELDEHEIASVVANNACEACHRRDLAEDEGREAAPRRASDHDGGFALLMVLARQMPISSARPLDLNHRDPFVQLSCRDGTRLVSLSPMPRCRDGESAVATRDVAAGLASGDAYTHRVCESRQFLWDHMDAHAREAFADSFRECGLVGDAPTLARATPPR